MRSWPGTSRHQPNFQSRRSTTPSAPSPPTQSFPLPYEDAHPKSPTRQGYRASTGLGTVTGHSPASGFMAGEGEAASSPDCAVVDADGDSVVAASSSVQEATARARTTASIARLTIAARRRSGAHAFTSDLHPGREIGSTFVVRRLQPPTSRWRPGGCLGSMRACTFS